MAQEFLRSGNNETARIYQAAGKYLLKVQEKAISPALAVTIWDEQARTITTGRTMDEYRDVFPLLRFVEEYVKQGMKFADIGGGVSGFEPYLAGLKPSKPPIVIDPLDYGMTEALLMDALRRAEKGEEPFVLQIDRIRTMLMSCQTIRDATRVELFNCTLGTAIRRHPHIAGTIDAVIDFNGAFEYAHTEDAYRESMDPLVRERQTETVVRLQRQLLTETGLLINSKKIT